MTRPSGAKNALVEFPSTSRSIPARHDFSRARSGRRPDDTAGDRRIQMPDGAQSSASLAACSRATSGRNGTGIERPPHRRQVAGATPCRKQAIPHSVAVAQHEEYHGTHQLHRFCGRIRDDRAIPKKRPAAFVTGLRFQTRDGRNPGEAACGPSGAPIRPVPRNAMLRSLLIICSPPPISSSICAG